MDYLDTHLKTRDALLAVPKEREREKKWIYEYDSEASMFYRSWSSDQSKFNEERLQAAIVPPRHIMTRAAVSCRHPFP